jgi:hypothetical protein
MRIYGLTKCSCCVELGGALTKDTVISATTHSFKIIANQLI